MYVCNWGAIILLKMALPASYTTKFTKGDVLAISEDYSVTLMCRTHATVIIDV